MTNINFKIPGETRKSLPAGDTHPGRGALELSQLAGAAVLRLLVGPVSAVVVAVAERDDGDAAVVVRTQRVAVLARVLRAVGPCSGVSTNSRIARAFQYVVL